MTIKDSKQELSVNFHLWQPCNYHCGFCFAGFEDVKRSVLPQGHLTKDKAEGVVRALAEHGFGKITFAGGEPTLCPWLHDLVAIAKSAGMVTMVVTNGSRLNEPMLNEYRPVLDWVVLSIDSIIPETNLNGGRFHNRRMLPESTHYRNLIALIHKMGFKFKINTVVHRYNMEETMSEFIESANPLRWKIFKVLSIKNQNDENYANYEISDEEFSQYLKRNTTRLTTKMIVAEDNSAMRESYLMIDPAGRFFDNATGKYSYSESICDIGVERALGQINFDYHKYKGRGGLYEW